MVGCALKTHLTIEDSLTYLSTCFVLDDIHVALKAVVGMISMGDEYLKLFRELIEADTFSST